MSTIAHMLRASSSAAAQDRPQSGGSSRLLRLAGLAERNAPRILAVLIVAYILIFFAASYYKYETFGQGYDQVDFEQAIWNTVQGRPFEDSRFTFTESVFGLDWMPMLALFVPFYALIPSAHTLFFLQIVAGALGAVAVYLLAKDIIGSKLAALVFGILWLLYPTIEHLLLNPFQVRIFATTALLFALLFYERKQLWSFLACTLFAMSARTDVSLVVIMIGVYGLTMRRRWPFVVAPLVLGAGYFLVVMTFIMPAFIHMPQVDCVRITDPVVLARSWPGNSNPNLGYYLHWGCSSGEILVNLVKDPLFTLNYMFGDLDKIGYITAMLAPFGFLSLLAPRGLLLSLPIMGLNLIAWRTGQTDYRLQYALLITVGVVLSAIYGYKTLMTWLERRRTADPRLLSSGQLGRLAPLAILLIVGLILAVLQSNPVIRAFRFPEKPVKVAAANEFIAMVPQEAHVAASSKIGPRLLPRRYIYNFPPAPYSPYSMEDYGQLEYILVDPEADALTANLLPNGKTALQELQTSPQWTLVGEKAEIMLWKHR